jgi:uncharacterized protein YdaU (DUF1376 family)
VALAAGRACQQDKHWFILRCSIEDRPVDGKEEVAVEDPVLEANIQRVKELINIWQEYYNLLLAAFDKEKPLPADAGQRFDRVKAVVAQRHDQFQAVIKKDHYVAQNILQMVKRTIAITDFLKSSAVSVDKTLIEWHEANILLYETLGSLELQRDRLAKVSEADVKKQEAMRQRQDKINKIKNNPMLYTSLKVILVVSLIAGFWFSPVSTYVGNIGFVRSRINDFRLIIGMRPIEDPNKPDVPVVAPK